MPGKPPSGRLRAPNAAAGHADMRATNRGVVLDLIRREGPLSRADLAKISGLAKPTTSDIMEELVRERLVFELGVGPAGRVGGRRPVLYQFNPQAWYVVGIDVEVERTTIALADATGAETARTGIATRRRPVEAFRAVGGAVDELLGEHRVSRAKVAATSVSVPGLVDPASGVCVLAPNLGWRDVDVPGLLEPSLERPPEVHNVVEAVLFAEHLEGAAKDVDDAVLLYDDNGVGAAILIEGRIHRGPQGMAGEIGHCKLAGASRRCACGGVGCLETEVSTAAILRRAGRRGGARRHEALSALARSDDPAVVSLLDSVGQQLGHAGAWLVNLTNPEVVVIAGGFLDVGPRLFESVESTIRREALPELGRTVEVRKSALGSDAAVRGTVLLALRSTEVV